MKTLIFISCLFYTSCAYLPRGSNIRSGVVRTIDFDTIQFYGSAKKFILIGEVCMREKIQYTVIKNSTETKSQIIKKV